MIEIPTPAAKSEVRMDPNVLPIFSGIALIRPNGDEMVRIDFLAVDVNQNQIRQVTLPVVITMRHAEKLALAIQEHLMRRRGELVPGPQIVQ